MGITVATSTVTTSWQEIDVVEFTAGTLSNLAACLSEVQARINRGTLSGTTVPTDAQVNGWLTRAKEKLASIRNFSFARRYAYADTTSGTFRYALPPDYRGGSVRIRDITSGYSPREIKLVSAALFDHNFPDPDYDGTNRPESACIKNMELWLYPCPNSTYNLELDYTRSGEDQTASDISWLPEPYRWLCCDYATWHAFVALKEFDSAQMWKSEWVENIQIMQMADGKQKWGGTDLQCPVWVK